MRIVGVPPLTPNPVVASVEWNPNFEVVTKLIGELEQTLFTVAIRNRISHERPLYGQSALSAFKMNITEKGVMRHPIANSNHRQVKKLPGEESMQRSRIRPT